MSFKLRNIHKLLMAWSALAPLLTSCASSSTENLKAHIVIPYMRIENTECYYLDDFMPTPTSLVSGKNGELNLRFYTYKSADYKDWTDKRLMLSFYSKDKRCWTLFDEYPFGFF